jgi:preprotein translocase subunit SecE
MARNRQRARDRKERERLHREGVSGELDHASADVDQAEASIVAGADGEPTDVDDATLARQAEEAAPAPARDAGDAPASGRGGGRFLNFLRACWAELQRVRWPDRRQVGQATAVVLGFVVVAGAFLGLIDAAAERVVEFIL